MHAVKQTFEREGIPAPGGGARWDRTFFRACILDDVYKPHSFAEVKEWVLPEVAARLDPDATYRVWWFNRRRKWRTQVSESGLNKRSYRWRSATVIKPQNEWIAVPVPDPGIPDEWVIAAREAVKHNYRHSSKGRRFWELSGGILFCGGCGHVMTTQTVYSNGARSKTPRFYYRCNLRKKEGVDACGQAKNYRVGELEAKVWETVSGILKDPEQLRADLERMIQIEREGIHDDPKREAKGWLDKLAEVDRKRSGFQDMAAE